MMENLVLEEQPNFYSPSLKSLLGRKHLALSFILSLNYRGEFIQSLSLMPFDLGEFYEVAAS